MFRELAKHAELAVFVADASLPALVKLVEVSAVTKPLLLYACCLLSAAQPLADVHRPAITPLRHVVRVCAATARHLQRIRTLHPIMCLPCSSVHA